MARRPKNALSLQDEGNPYNPLSAPGDISEAAEVPPIGSSGWAANFRPSTNIEDRRGQDPEIARMWGMVNGIQNAAPGDAANFVDTPDYTDKYNTKLSAKDEAAFQAWGKQMAAQSRSNPADNTHDYDMRGFWKAVNNDPQFDAVEAYAKPNHPIFSDQSQYWGI